MSDHKKPLTLIEETGIILHGFGCDIGKPSLIVDVFRHGIAWGQSSVKEQIAEAKRSVEHDMQYDDELRARLSELLTAMERASSGA